MPRGSSFPGDSGSGSDLTGPTPPGPLGELQGLLGSSAGLSERKRRTDQHNAKRNGTQTPSVWPYGPEGGEFPGNSDITLGKLTNK